jgi:UV excision repair protein RAD23
MIQNPDNVQPLIQQLATQNPQIAQVLGQNPEALMDLLGVQISNVDMEGQPIPPGAQVVSVTEEERAAIERVSLFGICDCLKLK